MVVIIFLTRVCGHRLTLGQTTGSRGGRAHCLNIRTLEHDQLEGTDASHHRQQFAEQGSGRSVVWTMSMIKPSVSGFRQRGA